ATSASSLSFGCAIGRALFHHKYEEPLLARRARQTGSPTHKQGRLKSPCLRVGLWRVVSVHHLFVRRALLARPVLAAAVAAGPARSGVPSVAATPAAAVAARALAALPAAGGGADRLRRQAGRLAQQRLTRQLDAVVLVDGDHLHLQLVADLDHLVDPAD